MRALRNQFFDSSLQNTDEFLSLWINSLFSCPCCPYSPSRDPLPCLPAKKTPVFLTSNQVSPSLLSALLALEPQLSPEK